MNWKELLFRGAQGAGVLGLVRESAWRRRRLLILCYHGVAAHDEHEWNSALYVTPALLRSRLQHLKANGYTIRPLAEACSQLASGTLPPRSVALTFDDGTADFAAVAVPILEEFNAPATVYLTTYYADAGVPVFDTVLSYVLWRGRASGGDAGASCGGAEPLPVGSARERQRAWEVLHRHALNAQLDVLAKDALVARVAAALGVDYDAVRRSGTLTIMSPEAIAALPERLIDVQLHTHRHRSPTSRELFERELRDNAAELIRLRGDRTLDHFCYPNGFTDERFLQWLSDFGVRHATTCVPGIASRHDHPLLLPRFLDHAGHSPAFFEAWCSGVASWLWVRSKYRHR